MRSRGSLTATSAAAGGSVQAIGVVVHQAAQDPEAGHQLAGRQVAPAGQPGGEPEEELRHRFVQRGRGSLTGLSGPRRNRCGWRAHRRRCAGCR